MFTLFYQPFASVFGQNGQKASMIHVRPLGPEIFLDAYPFKIAMRFFYLERAVYFDKLVSGSSLGTRI